MADETDPAAATQPDDGEKVAALASAGEDSTVDDQQKAKMTGGATDDGDTATQETNDDEASGLETEAASAMETVEDDGDDGDEVMEEADDDDADEAEDVDEDDDASATSIGGKITGSSPAYALLTGIYKDPKTNTSTPVSVPLTRIPATLGRTHATTSKSFFGLGKARALSRSHFSIYYRDGTGGTLQYSEQNDGLSYHPQGDTKNSDIIKPSDVAHPPPNGFFVVECISKNKITVGGSRIEQGQAALLRHGTTIRLGSYSLYFLLPEDAAKTTMKVPNPQYATYQRKRAREEAKVEVEEKQSAAAGKSSKAKKAKTTAAAAASSDESDSNKKVKKELTGQARTIADLEALSTETLLQRCDEACDSETAWERPHQLLNSAVALHAVKAALRTKTLRDIHAEHGGVTRGEVLEWIKSSEVFEGWVEQMLGKLEPKSYEKNISNAISKVGCTRSGSTGRHVRWALPKNLGKKEPEEDGSDDDDSSSEDHEDEEEEDEEEDAEPAATSGDEDSDDSGAKAKASGGVKGQAKVISDLETLSTATLLQRCNEACAGENAWERHHQLLNSAVSSHAVKAAIKTKTLRDIHAEHGGVTRRDVLGWIKTSDVFKGWVEQMLGKLEPKSYEKNIMNAIVRAGCTRTGSTGRQARWALPEEVEVGDDNNDDDDDDDDSEDDEEGEDTKPAATSGGEDADSGAAEAEADTEMVDEGAQEEKKEPDIPAVRANGAATVEKNGDNAAAAD